MRTAAASAPTHAILCCRQRRTNAPRPSAEQLLPFLQGEKGAAAGGQDAAAVHAAWLARQYALFQTRLLALLGGTGASLQVGIVCVQQPVLTHVCA